MLENWNMRLKECREKKGYTLKSLEGLSKLDLSQQSLIKYEKGEVFPRINILEKMCKIYGTTIDYILYGKQKLAQFEDRSSSLVTIFMLLYLNKITLDTDSDNLKINDKRLLSQIIALNNYKSIADISSIDDLIRLIQGIKKMENEKWTTFNWDIMLL